MGIGMIGFDAVRYHWSRRLSPDAYVSNDAGLRLRRIHDRSEQADFSGPDGS